MRGLAVALLVARSGRIREAWRAVLLSTCCIDTVHVAGDASGFLRALDTHGPDLVLLDAEELGNETFRLMDVIRAKRPASRCIVLVRGEDEAREAQSLGAAEILIKGSSAAQLFEAVERVLAWPGRLSDEFEPA
jgi:DNA-binding NarL/FixJ family response regulator